MWYAVYFEGSDIILKTYTLPSSPPTPISLHAIMVRHVVFLEFQFYCKILGAICFTVY